MNRPLLRSSLKALLVLAALLLAWSLRMRAVELLPGDYDEDDYLRAAQQFSTLIRSGDWAGFTQTNYRQEHPPLAKYVFALSLLSVPPEPLLPDRPTTAEPDQNLPAGQLRAARTTSALFGALTAGLLALVNPFAGLLLAIHAMTIKYDSQVMLEALPALTSLGLVLAYLQYKQRQRAGWLVISAFCLGLTAASKYLYCVAALAVLLDWFLVARAQGGLPSFFKRAALWVLAGLAVFFLADPYLWPNPLGRLQASVFYLANYAGSASEVQSANFPLWQPLIWLNTSPYFWQDTPAFLLGLDGLIALLACFGLKRLWQKSRLYVLWLGIALLFLFVWPTKWPQYILTLTAPLALAAAEGFMALIILPARAWWAGRTSPRPAVRSQLRQALPWLVLGLLAFVIFTLGPLSFQFAVSLTDFNSISIRDGLNGGIWREVWGGLTGQIQPAGTFFPFRLNTVHFNGPSTYLPILNLITANGLLVFNILWTLFSVSLQAALGLSAALLLSQKGLKLRRGWELLFILPWAIPEMIGALIWFNVFAPTTGWLSLAAATYGPHIPFGFLLGWEKNPNLQMLVLLIAAVWYGFPFIMLAASAALKLLPGEVYDAARIDGANTWQTFKYVTWPLLLPLLLPALLIRGVFSFNQFYLFQVFRFGSGTLANLSYNLFNPSGFGVNGQFAVSAALNIITMLMLVGFVVLFNRWSKAGEGLTYA